MSTNVYLKNKIEERTSQAQVLENLQKTAADEKRDMTADERKTFSGIVERLGFLDDEIKRIAAAEEGASKFVEIYGQHRETQAREDARRQRAREDRERESAPEQRSARTWGQLFTESEEFKSYHGHGASGMFLIEGPYLEERQTTFAHFGPGQNVMAGGFDPNPWVQQWAGPTQPPLRTPLFDVIGRVPTTLGSIEYYYWHDDPERMASEVPEGELKPEATISGEIHAVPISTYAWWKGITRQALDDIPMIQSVIDTALRRGVIRRIHTEAAQALTGNGDIPVIGSGGGVDLLAVIRAGLAWVDTAGFGANSVLLNPQDWAAMDMEMLRLTGAGMNIQNAFWGMSPVPLPGIPSGTAYVGDFSEGVTFFDRQQIQVLMTDSHAEYFLRNKLVLLAEARGKIVVTNAAAMVKCQGEVPSVVLNGNGNGNGNGDTETNGITGSPSHAGAARSGARRAPAAAATPKGE